MAGGDPEGRLAPRTTQFKPKVGRDLEASRRRAALASQQDDARASRIANVRRVAMEALLRQDENDVEAKVEIEDELDEEGEDAGGACGDMDMVDSKGGKHGDKMRRLRSLNRTLFFARQLQIPDWMVEVPADLGSSWLLAVKPEGERCLLLSEGGRVEVRRKNGYVLERYVDSRLPQGLTVLDVVCIEGPAPDVTSNGVEAESVSSTAGKPSELGSVEIDDGATAAETGADCVMDDHGRVADGRHGRGGTKGGGKNSSKGGTHRRRGRPQGDRTYAVMDVLVWGDHELIDATAECRTFWLESRFSEISEKHARRARPLRLIPSVSCTQEALQKAYQEDVGYAKDSLFFLHREGHYALFEPSTPLALFWRDRQLSRYVVDTPDPNGVELPEKQAVVLELRGSGYVRTSDHLIVARLLDDSLAHALKLSQTRTSVLMRFEIDRVDAAARRLDGVRPVAFVSSRSRIVADSWGRIAFQDAHRRGDAASLAIGVLAHACGA